MKKILIAAVVGAFALPLGAEMNESAALEELKSSAWETIAPGAG